MAAQKPWLVRQERAIVVNNIGSDWYAMRYDTGHDQNITVAKL